MLRTIPVEVPGLSSAHISRNIALPSRLPTNSLFVPFNQSIEPTNPVGVTVCSIGYGSVVERIDTALPVPPIAM